MKKLILIFLSIILVVSLSSCGLNLPKPDSVKINGVEYKRAFIGDLYPLTDTSGEPTKVKGNAYYECSNTSYGCYIAYDQNAEPNIYFASERFDKAVSHYTDENNFNFFCLIGNVHDENQQQIFQLTDIDNSKFQSFVDFSHSNSYNPLTSFNDDKNLKKLPITSSDNWADDEIHFYKESKDEAFSTSRAYTLKLYENKLYFLYYYDASNKIMLVKDIPTELNDYFLSLLYQQNIITQIPHN